MIFSVLNIVTASRRNMQWRVLHEEKYYFLLLLFHFTLYRCAIGQNLVYSIMEELPSNTYVANVIADAELNLIYTPDTLYNLRYFVTDMQRSSKNDNKYFFVEESTGILMTTEQIDRESICPQMIECHLEFNIMIQPAEFFRIIPIRVTIIDDNDNMPKFAKLNVERSISEGSNVGTVVPIPSAVDLDSGLFGIQYYDLIAEAGNAFELRVTMTDNGIEDLSLIIHTKFDREVKDHYDLEIVASDGGSPPKSGSMQLKIIITDVNDNNPAFIENSYVLSISEDARIGENILTVTATDADAGINGRISYQFAPETKQNYGTLFGITQNSGDIFLLDHIDFKKGSKYVLSVMASDDGLNSLPAYTRVTIHVVDINDHAPSIKVNALTSSGYVEVSESATVGQFVAFISIIDVDSGLGGEFSCKMKNPHFALKELYTTEFKIITKSPLDRESRSKYNLRITCIDKGEPQQTSTELIKVTVLDDNDNYPVFQHDPYEVEIRENNKVGDFISQVVATDIDSGKNGLVNYRIIDNNQSLISLDKTTGIIRANCVFDYEMNKDFLFHISAFDSSSKPKESKTNFHLFIMDTNDIAPFFRVKIYVFHLDENLPEHSFVGTVIADDNDSNPYNVINYSILPHNSAYNYFDIETSSGHIYTTVSLDREMKSIYSLTVKASNKGYPKMFNTINVTIYINDLNDNSPIIDFPAHQNQTLFIRHSTKVGTVIGKIIAHDLDKGANGELSYYLSENQKRFDMVHIDIENGDITLICSLEDITNQNYEFEIIVSDLGSPPFQNKRKLLLLVNNSTLEGITQFFSVVSQNRTFSIFLSIFCIIIFIFIIIIILICCKAHKNRRKYNDDIINGMNYESQVGPPILSKSLSYTGSNVSPIGSQNDLNSKKAVTFRVHLDEDDLKYSNIGQNDENGDIKIILSVKDCLKGSAIGYPNESEISVPLLNRNKINSPAYRRPPRRSIPGDCRDINCRNHQNYGGLTKSQLEMHEMWQLLGDDADSENESYADSGHGPSEEGDTLTPSGLAMEPIFEEMNSHTVEVYPYEHKRMSNSSLSRSNENCQHMIPIQNKEKSPHKINQPQRYCKHDAYNRQPRYPTKKKMDNIYPVSIMRNTDKTWGPAMESTL